MEEDRELKLITARKLADLRRRAQAAAPREEKPVKSARDLVYERLYDRGDEVLNAAYSYFPRETQAVVEQLARILKQGGNIDRISGGELYSLFRSIGLRFNLKTSIKIQERGKFVDLKDKLKMRKEGEA